MICSEPFLLFQTYTFWALCDLPHFHVSTCFCAHWMPDVGEENRVRLHNHSTIVLSTPSTPSCLRNGKSRGQNFKKKKKKLEQLSLWNPKGFQEGWSWDVATSTLVCHRQENTDVVLDPETVAARGHTGCLNSQKEVMCYSWRNIT